MMPHTALRAATPTDVPRLLEFIRELAAYERLEHEVVATEASIAALLFGERPVAEALIACVDGEAVGFALFCTNVSTFRGLPGMYLEDIFVRPAYRGLGLGRALLVRVGELACERGCGRYEWSVLAWNEPAIRFYESLGAVMHGDWRRMRIEGPALAELG